MLRALQTCARRLRYRECWGDGCGEEGGGVGRCVCRGVVRVGRGTDYAEVSEKLWLASM